MPEDIEVNMGCLRIARAPTKLLALGIGSCVVIALYDSALRIGGLAHAMLPDSGEYHNTTKSLKYVDLAIAELIRKLENNGSTKTGMEAKLVGGANLFSDIQPGLVSEIGNENVLAARRKLKQEGISVTGELVRGSRGMSVEFDTLSGIVTVKMRI